MFRGSNHGDVGAAGPSGRSELDRHIAEAVDAALEIVAAGPTVRNVEGGDMVLFAPDAGYEVEIRGEEYLILRERDIHAVASERIEGGTGLYL